MSRLTPPWTLNLHHHIRRRGNNFLFSINIFFARLKRQVSGGSRKKSETTTTAAAGSPKSPLAKSKQLFVNLSNKAIIPFRRHKQGEKSSDSSCEFESAELDFGDGGLWQRDILMGDKCQPLNFSGVIYYDSNGRQRSELPIKSPRASPLPSYVYASSDKY